MPKATSRQVITARTTVAIPVIRALQWSVAPSEPPSRIEDYIVTVAILGGIGCLGYLAFKGKTR
jgi:hypothetical protein